MPVLCLAGGIEQEDTSSGVVCIALTIANPIGVVFLVGLAGTTGRLGWDSYQWIWGDDCIGVATMLLDRWLTKLSATFRLVGRAWNARGRAAGNMGLGLANGHGRLPLYDENHRFGVHWSTGRAWKSRNQGNGGGMFSGMLGTDTGLLPSQPQSLAVLASAQSNATRWVGRSANVVQGWTRKCTLLDRKSQPCTVCPSLLVA